MVRRSFRVNIAKRRVVIGANVHERDLGGFVAELQERTAKEIKLPPGYYFVWGGQFENMERAMATLRHDRADYFRRDFFPVCSCCLIRSSLPYLFSGLAVCFGGRRRSGYSLPASICRYRLRWVLSPCGASSILNGVVLISFIKELREQGLSVAEAVRNGCEATFPSGADDRRSDDTGLGAVPGCHRSWFRGAEAASDRGDSGLITATMMTIVLMPMLYRWFDDQPKPEGSETLTTSFHQVSTPICQPQFDLPNTRRIKEGFARHGES